ncbi:hypothetical protein Ancab_006433 [Ancistrocladus abbreviatus]
MSKQGPPKHQNKYAWKPDAGRKINETEPGGKFRPFSEVTGVCPRCKEQIEWKRKYGKYKALTEPAKCQRCSKRAVRQAYHNLCPGCARDQKVCAKCCCHVDQIVGRDSSEVEAEQKMLEEVELFPSFLFLLYWSVIGISYKECLREGPEVTISCYEPRQI